MYIYIYIGYKKCNSTYFVIYVYVYTYMQYIYILFVIAHLLVKQENTHSSLAFSMELMVTPAAQDTMRWRSSMSGPISSRTNGMMSGFTARKRTSLLFTVSLLLVVKFIPIFCTEHVIYTLMALDLLMEKIFQCMTWLFQNNCDMCQRQTMCCGYP